MREHTFGGRLLVVGGHTRNIGKTSLVVDLIRAFPEACWTAVKITQYGHGMCSTNGEQCGCAPYEHAFSLDEETERNNHSDSSRFLAAGAKRSLWLRCKQGQMAEALPLLRDALSQTEYAIIESNTLLQFLLPSLYLVVLDPGQPDFKDSARRYLDRSDAFVLRGGPLESAAITADDLPAARWTGISLPQLAGKPHFVQPLGGPLPVPLLEFVREHFFGREWNSRRSVWHYRG